MCPEREENSRKRCREATSESLNKRRNGGSFCSLRILKDFPQLSTISTISEGTSSKSESFCPKFVYSRRKLQSNSICEKALKCEDFLLRITSDAPFAAFEEKEVVLQAVCKSEVVRVPQLSTITTNSRSSVPQCIYSERELMSNIVTKFLTEAPQETNRSLEVISSDAPSVAVTEEEADLQIVCKHEVVGVPQSSTINTALENSLPKFVYRRRKLQSNTMATNLIVATAETDKNVEDFLSASSSASPSVALKEKEVVRQATFKNVAEVAQLSTISTMSVPKFVFYRRKLWNKSLASSSIETPAKKNAEDFLLEISPDAQSVACKEKEEFQLAVSKNEAVGVPQPSIIHTMSESSLPKFVYTRRKLPSNDVANPLRDPPEKAKKSVEDARAVLCSNGPSIALKEKVLEAVCMNEVVGVPQLSTFSPSSKNSLPKFVYSRMKLQRDSWPNSSTETPGKKMNSMGRFPSVINSDVQEVTCKEKDVVLQVLSVNVVGVPQPSTISTSSECSLPKFVYSRKKLRRNSVANVLTEPSGKAMRSMEKFISAINSDASSVAFKEKDIVLQAPSTNEVGGVPQLSTISTSVKTLPKFIYCRKKLRRKAVVNCLVESTGKTMRSMQHSSGCSSSRPMAREKVGKDQSEQEVCISILKSQGVLQSVCNSQNNISSELDDGSSGNISYRSCKICNVTDSSLKMLICDECEEAFHLSCCNSRVKRIPDQEWCCRSCSKKKQKVIRETFSTKTPKMAGVTDKHKSASSRDVSPIVLMLRDTEPYITGVRVGKGFQADVPDWSGPIDDDGTFGEPTELDSSESTSHSSQLPKLPVTVNLLQCKGVNSEMQEGCNGSALVKHPRTSENARQISRHGPDVKIAEC